MKNLNVFMVTVTEEMVYEFTHTSTVLITLDRDEAITCAHELIDGQKPFNGDYTFTKVFGSELGQRSEPVEILVHRTCWDDEPETSSKDNGIDDIRQSDTDLLSIEIDLTKSRRVVTGYSNFSDTILDGLV